MTISAEASRTEGAGTVHLRGPVERRDGEDRVRDRRPPGSRSGGSVGPTDGPRRTVAGALALLLAASPARAAVSTPQDAAASRLDLRGFLVGVLERSPGAEASVLRREASGHEAAALGSPPNPTLEAEGPDSEDVVQLQLRQPLRLFGQGDALRRLGRAERTQADHRLTMEHASLARETGRLWVASLARRRELSLAERALGLREDAAELGRVALRRGWGSRERARRLRLEARAADRRVQALRSAVRRDRRELNRLLGRAGEEPLQMVGALAGDEDRNAGPPVPEELPPDAPGLEVARSAIAVAEAELERARTLGRPVPSVGPMVSLGKGVDPGVGLELSLPVLNTHGEEALAARSRLEAARAGARASGRSRRREYHRLLDRREALLRELRSLRSRELDPARTEVRRWVASRDLGLPVTGRIRRARLRATELRREELRIQRRLTLLELDAAWRSGTLLSWLRVPASGEPVPGASGGEGRP